MNATKQKILTTSLTLFNQHGIAKVSLRTIADSMQISVGNLQYHFKKRDAILETLYFELVEKIDRIIITATDDLLASVCAITTEICALFFEYRFFLLDFTAICRNNEKIKQHYASLYKRREAEFLQIVAMLIQHGLLRQEVLQHEFLYLFKRMEVISNFWFSSVLTQGHELSESTIQEYEIMMSQNLYPYLTEKGKLQYRKIFPDQML